jgi:hypothetical protein
MSRLPKVVVVLRHTAEFSPRKSSISSRSGRQSGRLPSPLLGSKKQLFPNSCFAKNVLFVQATSVSPERSFSCGRLILPHTYFPLCLGESFVSTGLHSELEMWCWPIHPQKCYSLILLSKNVDRVVFEEILKALICDCPPRVK